MLHLLCSLLPPPRKWYAVLDPSSNGSSIDQGMALNAQLIKLPTTDSEDFQQNLKVSTAQHSTAQHGMPQHLVMGLALQQKHLGQHYCLTATLASPAKLVFVSPKLGPAALLVCAGQADFASVGHGMPSAWLQVCYVPGVTLFLDFPFPAFPDNLGHWAELLLPLYSTLSTKHWQQHLQGDHQHINRLLLLNVRQQLLYNWPKEVLGLALTPALPPWPDPGDSSSSSSSSGGSRFGWHETLPWERPLPPIVNPVDYEEWSASGWLVFENIVVLQDRCALETCPLVASGPKFGPKPCLGSDVRCWACQCIPHARRVAVHFL
jgi:hypothetical protein